MIDAVQQRAMATLDLVIILLVLCWVAVFLRLWVRIRITKSPSWDDAFMVLTLCLFTCYSSFILVISAQGAFNHRPTIESLTKTLVFIELSEVFYILTTTTLKISLGLFFLRIVTKQWQVLVFQIILGVSAVYGVFYVFIAIFQCGDPSRLLANLADSQCLPTPFLLTTGYIYGIVNVLADWTFVLIPIFVLIESDMDRKSKISVSIVMALGAVGSISSILRMVYLKGLLFGGNYISEAVNATIWATAEPGTGIIAASIAILRPLFRQIKGELREKVSQMGSSSSSRGIRSHPQFGGHNNDSQIALTSVVTTITGNASKKASIYPIPSPMNDTWGHRITTERAHIARVVHVKMSSNDTVSWQTLPGS